MYHFDYINKNTLHLEDRIYKHFLSLSYICHLINKSYAAYSEELSHFADANHEPGIDVICKDQY